MTVDWFSLPLGANPDRDTPFGQDELGNQQYRMADGRTYVIRPAPQRQRVGAPGSRERVKSVLSERLRGMIDGVKGAIAGPSNPNATYGDAFNAAGMVQLGGAAMPAPKGAVRSGAMRTVLEADDLTPAKAKAETIMQMLRDGRGSDVTEGMMAGADQSYLSSIYDLPLDEGSRMARAVDQGYAHARRSQSPDDPFNDTTWAMFADHGGDPVGTLEALETYGPGQWLGKPDLEGRAAAKAVIRSARDYGAAQHEGVTGAEIARRSFPDAIVDGAGLWDDYTPAKFTAEGLTAEGVSSIKTPDGMIAFTPEDSYGGLPPVGVRAANARFDPRLSHLRNYYAANASPTVGLFTLQSDENAKRTLADYLRGRQ